MNIDNIDKGVALRNKATKINDLMGDFWMAYVTVEEKQEPALIRVEGQQRNSCNISLADISRETYDKVFEIIHQDLKSKKDVLLKQIELL